MAYRAKHIEDYIKKVEEEARDAAQAVFDKYNAKLQEMVNNQVLEGQKLYVGMGTATIRDESRELDYDYAEKFLFALSDIQYCPFRKRGWNVGFSIDHVDKTKKVR